MQNQQGIGYLKVQTTSANGAFPVEGALVSVSDEKGSSVASLRTNRSGLTEVISLPAPPRYLSESPQEGQIVPYSVFTVRISRDGYYPVEDYSVPVFDTVTSIQKVNLIPLSEFSPLPPNPRPQLIETPGYPELQGKGGGLN